MNPLTFESFVMLMGFKTIEMDPEDVMVEALSKWDLQKLGVIDEAKHVSFNLLKNNQF